jgi:hypothetical protein
MKPHHFLYTKLPASKIAINPENWNKCKVYKNSDRILMINESNKNYLTIFNFETIEKNHTKSFDLIFYKMLNDSIDKLMSLKGYIEYEIEKECEISENRFGECSKVVFEKSHENDIAKIFIGCQDDFEIFHDKILKK